MSTHSIFISYSLFILLYCYSSLLAQSESTLRGPSSLPSMTTTSYKTTKRPSNIKIDEALCFQKRYFSQEYEEKYREICRKELIDNFCEHVQCLAIKSCPEGSVLLENVVGRGCCPACVQLLDKGDTCNSDLTLARCKNGLICNHSKRICEIPEFTPVQSCLREYHNRWIVTKYNKSFYIPSLDEKMFFSIPYSEEQFLPQCTFDGNYEPKQRSRNKAYCVNPNDGKPTFGLIDSHRSINQTCKCSTFMLEKLSMAKDRLNPRNENLQLDKVITKFNSDTHMKCKFSGNFQEVQCINETCLCVNEKTGQPVLDVKEILNISTEKILYQPPQPKYIRFQAAVVYGALNRLACFDEERNENKKKPIDKIYIEDCFQEVYRSNMMTYHFFKKGTTLEGLVDAKCGFDDRYYRVQCPDAICTCHDPDGNLISPYRAESTLSQSIDCRCALEEYLAKNDKQSLDILKCNGQGNFRAVQCTSNDQICYCTDDNGAKISKRFLSERINEFITKMAPNLIIENICQIMRNTLNNRNNKLIEDNQEFILDQRSKSYKIGTKPRPDQIFNYNANE